MAEVHLFLANCSTSIFQSIVNTLPWPLIDLLLFSLCNPFCFTFCFSHSLCTIFNIRINHTNGCDLDLLLGVFIPLSAFRPVHSDNTARPAAARPCDILAARILSFQSPSPQLRGPKDGQRIREWPGTRPGLTSLTARSLAVWYTSHSPSRQPVWSSWCLSIGRT